MKKVPANKIHIVLPIPNRKHIVIATIIIVFLLFGLLGAALAYSTKLKVDGDKEYKNGSYSAALAAYQQAQQWWLPVKISFKLRDRDLYLKLKKAEIMIRSGNNYISGKKAFNDKNYQEAKKYFSSLVVNDPHYDETQKILNKILKIENETVLKQKKTEEELGNIPAIIKETNTQTKTTIEQQKSPIIRSISDNFGNTFNMNCQWFSTHYECYPTDQKKPIISTKTSSQITFTIQATDPNGRFLEYRFSYLNGCQENNSNWVKSSSCTSKLDTDSLGIQIFVFNVKNDDNYGSVGLDANTALYYEITE